MRAPALAQLEAGGGLDGQADDAQVTLQVTRQAIDKRPGGQASRSIVRIKLHQDGLALAQRGLDV